MDFLPGADPGRPTALVVEDDASCRKVLTELLTADGWIVAAEGSARAALEHIARHGAPDAVVVDYTLPDAPGTDLVRHLRGLASTCRVTLVMCSGHEAAVVEPHARAAGADEYFQKPLDFEQLLGRLERVTAAVPGA